MVIVLLLKIVDTAGSSEQEECSHPHSPWAWSLAITCG